MAHEEEPVHIGRWIGNYVGWDQHRELYAMIEPAFPHRRRLIWVPEHVGTTYGIAIDDRIIARTTELAYPGVPQLARACLDVWEWTPGLESEDLSPFLCEPADRVLLSWTGIAGDVHHYKLYRRDCVPTTTTTAAPTTTTTAPGTTTTAAPTTTTTMPPIAYFDAVEGFEYEYEDGPLDDGVYCYWLSSHDEAGNVSLSAEVEVTVGAHPNPPSDLALTHNDVTGVTTLTWTHSDSEDIQHYAIRYGDPPRIDDAAEAADPASPWTQNNAAFTGHREFLLRTVDNGNQEEKNLREMVAFELIAGVMVHRPNEPSIYSVYPSEGGQLCVIAQYDRTNEDGVATLINLYANDGLGGPVNWAAPVATAALGDLMLQSVVVCSAAFVGGRTYEVGVRAETAGGVTGDNENTEDGVTDAIPPGAPGLSAEVW